MRVANYKMQYGTFYPASVRNYVHSRVATLRKTIEKELGDDYRVEFHASKESEASYIRIRNKRKNYAYKLSIRNHGSFIQKKQYDGCVILSKYDTWSDCKSYIMEELLPKIRYEIDYVRPLSDDIARELDARLGALLRKNARESSLEQFVCVPS